MPAVPSCLLDPIREQFLAMLAKRPVGHPRGCHRRRLPDPVVFDKLVQVVVSGAGYPRVAAVRCSATTVRRRRDEWSAAGVMEQLRLLAGQADDQMVGLQLADLPADGCRTPAPSGGDCAGKSPVDRAKQGMKRAPLTAAAGVPGGAVPAPGNVRDHPLLPATLDTLAALGPLPDGAPVPLVLQL